MAQYGFGSGALWGTTSAGAVTTRTPSQFGALQSIALDFTATIKELYGTFQFPLTVARGTVKVTGKAKMGQLQGRVFNDLFFSGTSAAGITTAVNDELVTCSASGAVANGATWVTDLGVVGVGTQPGVRFQRVTGSPTAGQYTATSGGLYGFAAADIAAGKTVFIDYTYTTTGGQTISVSNQLLGVAPVFTPVLAMNYTNPAGSVQQLCISMNAATSNKLSLATKLEDFLMPELDFSCFCDVNGVLCSISLAEAG